MPQIYDLPPELVSEIASYLDFVDVISLRQSTRILRKSTEDPVVWYWLARKYAEQHLNIPRPENGTIETLKASDLREWIWPRLVVDHVWRKKSAASTNHAINIHEDVRCLGLVYGGRWLLAGRRSGQVDFCDLSSNEPSFLPLSKPSMGNNEEEGPSNFAISINASAPSLEFTLAVNCTGVIGPLNQWSMWLHIRRVNLVGAGPSATLQAHKPISIPHARTRAQLTAIGLSGDLLAWNMYSGTLRQNCIGVFRWTECSTEKLMAAYIRIYNEYLAHYIYFIGEDRLLYVTCGIILVYQIPTLAHLPADRDPTVEYLGPGEGDAQPVWTFERGIGIPLRVPAFSPDGVGHRLVTQDGSTIVGIYFPPSLNDQPSVKFRVELGFSRSSMVGLFKGCMMGADGNSTRFGYGRNGTGKEVFSHVNHSSDPLPPSYKYGMLFDEETGRCIIRQTKNRVLVVDFLPQ